MHRGSSVGLVAALLASLILGACGAGGTVGSSDGPAAATGDDPGPLPPAPEDPAPEPGPGPGPAPEEDPVPDRPEPVPDTAPPGMCDEPTRNAIASTLAAQLDAFAAEDLTAAYATTSPFFRSFLDEEAFETLIRTQYPDLVGNDGYRFDDCGVRGRRGFIVVGVRNGAREIVLRYDVSLEDGGWRIDGALELPGVTLPPEPLV